MYFASTQRKSGFFILSLNQPVNTVHFQLTIAADLYFRFAIDGRCAGFGLER